MISGDIATSCHKARSRSDGSSSVRRMATVDVTSSSLSYSYNGTTASSSNGSDSAPQPLPVPPVSVKPGTLPDFPTLSAPVFMWGPRSGIDFCNDVDRAYELTTKWRKNVFKLPSGSEAKRFLQCLTSLYSAFGERSALECIAFKATAVTSTMCWQAKLL